MFEKKTDPYRHAISFGRTCQPAWHLRKNKLRTASYPFDWIGTPAESLCEMLETDFKNFLNKPHLEILGENVMGKIDVIDRKHDILFSHDFTDAKRFDEEYPFLREKFQRRIERLYDVLQSGQRILLVRIRIDREDAQRITNTLNRKFPNLRYTLFAVDSTEEIREDWKIPNVVNRHMETAPDQDAVNKRYNKVWKKALGRFRFRMDRTNAANDLSGKEVEFIE